MRRSFSFRSSSTKRPPLRFGSVVLPEGVDPYRTQYGAFSAQRAMVLGLVMGVMLLLLGMAVLFLDHFSEERAETYHAQIIQELER